MSMPLRVRLTLWYTILLAGALIVFSTVVFLLVSRELTSDLNASLRQRLSQIRLEVDDSTTRLTRSSVADQMAGSAIPPILLSPSGRVIFGRPPPAVRTWLASQHGVFPSGVHLYGVTGAGVAVKPVARGPHRLGYVLVWQGTGSIDAARQSLLLVMLACGPALLAVAALGGFSLAKRALQPVSMLTTAAGAISTSDLHRRVPVGTTRDELSALAATFNEMIARLEGGVQREKSFTAAASHELRAPLSVIRAEATLALESPCGYSECQAAFRTIDEQAVTAEELLAALLMLARLETGMSFPRQSVSLADLVDNAVAEARASIDGADVPIAIYVPSETVVEGSVPLLVHAIRNLVENAVRASPPGGRVEIRAGTSATETFLDIIDSGPGIPAEHRKQIFDAFYQVDPARTPGASHGLGLAICQRILAAHGGRVTVDSTHTPGACFRVSLPMYSTGAL